MTTLHSAPSPRRHAQTPIKSRILKTVKRKKVCGIDDLLESCPDCSWDQVVLEVDSLSRSGTLCLCYRRDGDYAVSLPEA